MEDEAPWYVIDNIDQIDSPALLVFPDRIRHNIDLMIRMAGDPQRLQPHVKTYKMEAVVQMQMDQGINKFKCATIAEGEMLGRVGAKEVLLAYQPVGPKIQRLLQLVQQFPHTKFACLVDHPEAASAIARVFHAADHTLDVWLDLDVGMHRTGILPGEQAWALYQLCQQKAGIHPAGLHVYDGHFKERDFNLRKAQCDDSFQQVASLAATIRKNTGVTPHIIAGGSPTFPIHAQRSQVTCSPGTSLLWDWGYHEKLPEQPFQWAALVISRIISKPEKGLLCLDLGHKSIAAENPHPRVHFLNMPEAEAVLQSEEHLVLRVADDRSFSIGQVFYGVPLHICPTVALYGEAYVVENRRIQGTWKVVSRERKITI